MSIHPCTKCGVVRAKLGEKLCPVCWLVTELAREHKAGEHNDPEHPNASCVACMRPLRAQRTRKEPRRLMNQAVPHAGHGELRAELLRASETVIVNGDMAIKIPLPPDEVQAIMKAVRSQGAHANCDHPATKADRAKCRADRARRV